MEYVLSSVHLFKAIFQVVVATNIVLEVFGPVYLECGLGASISAHMIYNLSVIHLETSITVRLLIRLYGKFIAVFYKNIADAADKETDYFFNNDANEESGSK